MRNRIRATFSIPRSGSTEVNDGVIVSDGTTYNDLKNITTEKLQKYLVDDSTDFHKLFDKMIARMNEEIMDERKPKTINVSPNEPITVVIEPKKKRGRPFKNAKKE